MRPQRQTIFVASVAVIAAAAAWYFMRPTSRIQAAGEQTFAISDFARGIPVGQTFRILDDDLESVEVEFLAERPAELVVAARLLEGAPRGIARSEDSWTPIYEWTTTLRLPRGRTRRRFSFQPVFPSLQHVYQFQVQQLMVRPLDPDDSVAPVIGVVASRDEALPEGNVIIGRLQVLDRDLHFAAQTSDRVTRFRRWANPQLPRVLRVKSLQVGLLAAYLLALAVFVHHLLIASPENERT